ncbi:hypothetical protein [Hoyosella subflava]|nr:hypothetical protein [Hoyosella subflava]
MTATLEMLEYSENGISHTVDIRQEGFGHDRYSHALSVAHFREIGEIGT